MAYQRKTEDVWRLYADYGYGGGWEEVLEDTSREEARAHLKQYRENAPEYAYKIEKHRVRKEVTA